MSNRELSPITMPVNGDEQCHQQVITPFQLTLPELMATWLGYPFIIHVDMIELLAFCSIGIISVSDNTFNAFYINYLLLVCPKFYIIILFFRFIDFDMHIDIHYV